MPIRSEEILEVIKTVCDDEGIRVAAKENIKGGIIAGASAMIGGALLGPPGTPGRIWKKCKPPKFLFLHFRLPPFVKLAISLIDSK